MKFIAIIILMLGLTGCSTYCWPICYTNGETRFNQPIEKD